MMNCRIYTRLFIGSQHWCVNINFYSLRLNLIKHRIKFMEPLPVYLSCNLMLMDCSLEFWPNGTEWSDLKHPIIVRYFAINTID